MGDKQALIKTSYQELINSAAGPFTCGDQWRKGKQQVTIEAAKVPVFSLLQENENLKRVNVSNTW